MQDLIVMICSKCGKKYEWPNKTFMRYLRDHAGCDLDKYLCKECTTSARMQKHGESKSPLYARWKGLFTRTNPDSKTDSVLKYYVAKGVKVCAEWYDYKAFKKWALENGYDPRLTIDRKDNSKGYSPENCRWITQAEQNRNK